MGMASSTWHWQHNLKAAPRHHCLLASAIWLRPHPNAGTCQRVGGTCAHNSFCTCRLTMRAGAAGAARMAQPEVVPNLVCEQPGTVVPGICSSRAGRRRSHHREDEAHSAGMTGTPDHALRPGHTQGASTSPHLQAEQLQHVRAVASFQQARFDLHALLLLTEWDH
jgi:hypothetical protein